MQTPSPYFIRPELPRRDTDASWAPPTEGLHQGAAPELRYYWRIIRKHLRLIISLVICTTLITALVVFTEAPSFTSSATVLIEAAEAPRVLDMKNLIDTSAVSAEHDYYRTQFDILKSRTVAEQTIGDLALQFNPIFMYRTQPSLFSQAWDQLRGRIAGLLPGSPKAPASDPAGGQARIPAAVLAQYSGALEITPQTGTRLVNVSFSSRSPLLAAQIANGHVRSYMKQVLELRVAANTTTRDYLQQKLGDIRERVEKSEAALNAYRRQRGVVSFSLNDTDKGGALAQRLSELNLALAKAQEERIAMEAEHELVRQRQFDSIPEVLNSTLIQKLKQDNATLTEQYAGMSNRYNPGYHPFDDVKARYAAGVSRLDQEIAHVVAGIESAYQAARFREAQLQAQIGELKQQAMRLNEGSLQDAVLAREVDTNRQLYRSVLERMKQLDVDASVPTSNVSVVDWAVPPKVRSAPRRATDLVLSMIVAAMAGLSLAFVLDYFDDRLKNPDDVEAYLKVAHLGTVPDFVKLNSHSSYGRLTRNAPPRQVNGPDPPSRRQTSAKLILTKNPFSLASESYRAIRTSILFSCPGQPPKSILITSALSSEGKTVTVANVAIAFAELGSRAILVDTDMRRANCHVMFEMDNRQGLSEVLVGQTPLNEAIRPTSYKGLDLLSAGLMPPNPHQLLASIQMRQMITELESMYDFVLIDSAPLIPVSDGMVLAVMMNGVVLVVGRRAPKQVVRDARGRLNKVGANLLGVILNQVDVHSPDYYYYHRYDKYYTEYEARGSA